MATTFTLFLSGAWSDNAPRYNRMVDDSMPVIQLDVTESYTISLNNKLTNYAVEDRANISDHIFSDNIRIQAQCSIGLAKPYYNSYTNLITSDQDNAIKSNRPQQAYDLIKKLRDDRIQFDVLTEQELFEGMIITELSVAKEAGGTDQLTFHMTLEKPRFVSIGKTVLAQISVPVSDKSTKNKTADKASEGNKTTGDTKKAKMGYSLSSQSGSHAKFLESQGIVKDVELPQEITE